MRFGPHSGELLGSRLARVPAVAAGGGSGDITVAWDPAGADSYNVGWDTVSHAGGNQNDPTLYPNRANTTSLSYLISGWVGTLYWSVNSVVNGEIGPWATEDSIP